MQTPRSSVASLLDDAGSPFQGYPPRTAARHIYQPSSLALTPVNSKTVILRCSTSPQLSRSRSYGAEELHKTKPRLLTPTFLKVDCDDVDVSARLDLEFLTAAQSTQPNSKTCHSLPSNIDHSTMFAGADKLLFCNDGGCCFSNTRELTQAFEETAKTPCNGAPAAEEDRQGLDDAEDRQSTSSHSSVHTPVENIIHCLTPFWTAGLVTPQKSARPPSTRLWTPSTHRRAPSLTSIGVELGETRGMLPHKTHADVLLPNRNPCSPYREYAGERQALLQLHTGEEWDDSVASTTDAILRRVDACVVALEQTAPIAGTGREEAFRPLSCLPARRDGKAASALGGICKGEEEFLDLSSIPVEPEVAPRGNARPAAAVDAFSAQHPLADDCRASDDCADVQVAFSKACRSSPDNPRDGVWDAPTRYSTESQSSFEHIPKKLLETRNFYELCGQEWGCCSPLPGLKGLASGTARCAPSAGVHALRTTAKEVGFNTCYSPFYSSLSIRVDSQCLNSTGTLGQAPHKLHFCSESPLRLSSNGDYPVVGRPLSDDGEEEEVEPGDRFRSHHRYQFLHWLAWRKAYDFVPIHLECNGVAWLVTHRVDGLPYVVKEIPCSQRNSLQRELECLTLGNAPVSALRQQAADHITRYFTVTPYGVVAPDAQERMAFLLQTEYFPMGNVMEWALDPHQIRGAEFRVPPEDFWSCVLQHGLLAMESLHAARIIHGNPLPFNLFICNPRHYKLGCFGAAVKSPITYPVGSANVFLPPHTECAAQWTPYEMDVFLFAQGILQLMHQCICQRRVGAKTRQLHEGDGERVFRTLFLTDVTGLSLAEFQTDRERGHHAVSDHLWSVLQAALHRVPIQTLLHMLDAPSRPQWALRLLFSTEEFYLLRRKGQLERALGGRSRGKPQTEQQCESPLPRPASSLDDLVAPHEWPGRGHVVPPFPEAQFECHTSQSSLPQAPRTSASQGPLLSQGHGVEASPTLGQMQLKRHGADCYHHHGQGRIHQPKRQHGETQLSSCDTSAELFLLPRSCASRRLSFIQDNHFLFKNSLEVGVTDASPTSTGNGHPHQLSSRIEDNILASMQSRLDAHLFWTVRQIMVVMNWEDALKGMTVCGHGSTLARDSFPPSRGAVRPLTSWE
ncbi:transferase [Trypanosoma rangeli]|uniref:Transferase n=1 Tax=Trypanosoma rangeli TaxID=5698 RepID=A0A3R7NUF7_TRYRA|nr:transferase [Trypanosoma rangeli]RNF07860.1 transferase [Trypanosoma rangeli]|eukprot:RNF07860.1 transferase [Trypanosoma rangeli]